MNVGLQPEASSSTSLSLLERVQLQEAEAWRRFVTITLNEVRDLFRNRSNYVVGTAEVENLLLRIPAEDDAATQSGQTTSNLAHRALELIQSEPHASAQKSTWIRPAKISV